MRDIKFRAWDRLCKCYWYQGFAISPDGRVENLHGDIPKARIQAGWTIDKSYDSNLTGFDLEEFTGLKDKNGLTEVYEGDIIGSNGLVKGNRHDDPDLLKDETNLLIEGFGTKAWLTTYQKAVDRGCSDAQ